MANVAYNSFKKDLLSGAVNLSADSAPPGAVGTKLFAILLSASYTPDVDSHTRYRDVSAHEISIADPGRIVGYNSGGQGLSAVAFAQDNVTDFGGWDNTTDPSWTSATISARYLALVKIRNGGLNKENDNLVAVYDFGSTQSSNNGTFTTTISTSGLMILV